MNLPQTRYLLVSPAYWMGLVKGRGPIVIWASSESEFREKLKGKVQYDGWSVLRRKGGPLSQVNFEAEL
jgi:hypothetical protein